MTTNIYKEYWGEPQRQQQKQSWILPVETCCNHHGGDYCITFPDDLIEAVGWKIGDDLEWIDNNDGSFTLKKIN